MRADLNFVKERYDYFNRLCFNGILPQIKLRISPSLRTLGTFRFPRIRPKNLDASMLTLSVSNRLDFEPHVIEDTIIHEMIHLYIYWFDLRDSSSHGAIFRNMMAAINSRHGRSVTISRRSTTTERQSDRISKVRLILVCTLKSGERTVTVCAPKYARTIVNSANRINDIINYTLHLSNDSRFSKYPNSRTLKLYRINSVELDQSLRDSKKVDYSNGKFQYL